MAQECVGRGATAQHSAHAVRPRQLRPALHAKDGAYSSRGPLHSSFLPTGAPPSRHLSRRRRAQVQVQSAAVTADDGGIPLRFSPAYRWSLPTMRPETLATMASVVTVVLFGIANRILYRMALVPMRDYVFFLAQFQTFGYVVVYFAMLYLRMRSGKVPKEMLQGLPRGKFMLVGACEALAQVLLMMGAARLPGAVLPLVSQSVLLWNMALSATVLRVRVRWEQILGATLVIGGVAMATWPSAVCGCRVMTCEVSAISLCVLSFLFPSLGSIVKERIFQDAQQRLGRPLDIFVVNSFGSATQALFVVLLLPIITALKGMPLTSLPAYLHRGSQCFLGLAPTCGADCTGAPLLPALYVAANLAFNVAALQLLRSQGTVSLSLCMACLVPLTIWAFSLPIPYLDSAVLGPMFLAGTLVLMMGLSVFNIDHYRAHIRRFMHGRQ